jgi:hypothetical protein
MLREKNSINFLYQVYAYSVRVDLHMLHQQDQVHLPNVLTGVSPHFVGSAPRHHAPVKETREVKFVSGLTTK